MVHWPPPSLPKIHLGSLNFVFSEAQDIYLSKKHKLIPIWRKKFSTSQTLRAQKPRYFTFSLWCHFLGLTHGAGSAAIYGIIVVLIMLIYMHMSHARAVKYTQVDDLWAFAESDVACSYEAFVQKKNSKRNFKTIQKRSCMRPILPQIQQPFATPDNCVNDPPVWVHVPETAN